MIVCRQYRCFQSFLFYYSFQISVCYIFFIYKFHYLFFFFHAARVIEIVIKIKNYIYIYLSGKLWLSSLDRTTVPREEINCYSVETVEHLHHAFVKSLSKKFDSFYISLSHWIKITYVGKPIVRIFNKSVMS